MGEPTTLEVLRILRQYVTKIYTDLGLWDEGVNDIYRRALAFIEELEGEIKEERGE